MNQKPGMSKDQYISEDIIYDILENNTIAEILRFSQTSKIINNILRDDSFWKLLFTRDFPTFRLDKIGNLLSWKDNYILAEKQQKMKQQELSIISQEDILFNFKMLME